MKTVKGDLIKLAQEGKFDVIVHGCNCFCTMGAGIARQVASNFPDAYKADKETAIGDRSKLGTISISTEHGVGVVNAYTQFDFGGRGPNVDYDAVRSCFRQIKKMFSGCRIGYPDIGAGLAGGNWSVISEIIDEELAGEDHTLVEYDPSF